MIQVTNNLFAYQSNKRQIFFVFLLASAIGIASFALSGNLTYKNEAAEVGTKEATKDNLFKTPKTPEFAPGEVIVKFRSPLGLENVKMKDGSQFAQNANQDIMTFDSVIASTLPESIKGIDAISPIKSFEKVFKGVKTPEVELQKMRARSAVQGRQTQIDEKAFLANDLSNIYKFKLSDDTDLNKIIMSLKESRDIEYAEPNYIYTIDAIPNDPDFPKLWGLHNTGQTGGTVDADIDAPEAWDTTTGSQDVIVGVIDTGIDYTHPDLAANIWTNPGEIPNNSIDDDNNGYIDDIHGWDFANNDNDPMDDHGHGTHVAGTIGAVGNNNIGIVGVSWNVKMLGLKFLNNQGYGFVEDAVQAIYYATNKGVLLTNNSWGGGQYSAMLQSAITYAEASGSLFVAAAGNNGTNNDFNKHYPSSYENENVIAVAATDSTDNLTSFSNYGSSSVDIAAPGLNILSTLPNNQYAYYSGTSMASPHVAGVVALLLSQYPDSTSLAVKSNVLSMSDKTSTLEGDVLSRGRINAKNIFFQRNFLYYPEKIYAEGGLDDILMRNIIFTNNSAKPITWSTYTEIPEWLSLSKKNGTIAPFSFEKIETTMDLSQLIDGSGGVDLVFVSDDVDTKSFNISITAVLPKYKEIFVDVSYQGIEDGTELRPYRSIEKSLVDLRPFTTINIKPGTYFTRNILIDQSYVNLRSTNPGRAIIKCKLDELGIDCKGEAIITIAHPYSWDPIERVSVEDLTINSTRGDGVYVIGPSNNINISGNLIIQDRINTCDNNYCGDSGILVDFLSKDIVISNNIVNGYSNGIFLNGFGNDNGIIDNNYFANATYAAIQLNSHMESTAIKISRNIFVKNKAGIVNWTYFGKVSENLFLDNINVAIAIPVDPNNQKMQISNNSFIKNSSPSYPKQVFVSSNHTWVDPDTNTGNYWDGFDSLEEGAADSDHDGIVDTPYTINDLNKDDRPYINVVNHDTPVAKVEISPYLIYPGDEFTLESTVLQRFGERNQSSRIILNKDLPSQIDAEIINWSNTSIIARISPNAFPGIYKITLVLAANSLSVGDIGVILSNDYVLSPTATATPTPAPCTVPTLDTQQLQESSNQASQGSQTFTPAKFGKLGKVRIPLLHPPATGEVKSTLSFSEGGVTNTEKKFTKLLVKTSQVYIANIYWYEADFSSDNLIVEPGRIYTIKTNLGQFDAYPISGNNNPYPKGTYYDFSNIEQTNRDLVFEIYIHNANCLPYLRGDANNDKVINALDVTAIQKHISNRPPLLTGVNLENAMRAWTPFTRVTSEDMMAVQYCIAKGGMSPKCFDGFAVSPTNAVPTITPRR